MFAVWSSHEKIIKCKRRGIRTAYLKRDKQTCATTMARRPHKVSEVACGRVGGGWRPVIGVDPCLCGREEMQTGARHRLR